MPMLYLAQTMTEAHPARAVGYVVAKIATIVAVGWLIRRGLRRRRPRDGASSQGHVAPPFGAPYSPHPQGPWGPPHAHYPAPGQPWPGQTPAWPPTPQQPYPNPHTTPYPHRTR